MKNNLYHIVTRYTRKDKLLNEKPHDWLENCYKSITNLNIDFRWHLIAPYDKDQVDISGYKNTQYTQFKDQITMWNMFDFYFDSVIQEGQWFYALDDDNLMHPNFKLLDYVTEDDTKMIFFSQEYNEQCDFRFACEENIMIKKIDIGQICFKTEIVNELRFWNLYRADGYFIMELNLRSQERGIKKQILPDIASYYNAQLWINNKV